MGLKGTHRKNFPKSLSLFLTEVILKSKCSLLQEKHSSIFFLSTSNKSWTYFMPFQELDGKPIESFNVRHLRSEIGIVQQEPVLFDCSIRDNILYGIDTSKRNVTQSEIEEVCKNSNIHHFICDLPQVTQVFTLEVACINH